MNIFSNNENYQVILWRKDGFARYYEMHYLSFDFLEEDFDYILLLKFDFPIFLSDKDIMNLKKSLEVIYLEDLNIFTILTKRREAPLLNQSEDEFIYSFSCSFKNFKTTILNWDRNFFITNTFLFDFLDFIVSKEFVFNKILVRQIPFIQEKLTITSEYDVIIPHKGDWKYLRSALQFLKHLNTLKIYVGIDQEVDSDFILLKGDFNMAKYYNFDPNPAGPYIIRNYLIDHSKSELIFFQDSDDISCADRFLKLSQYIVGEGIELCGSHEVRIDYFDKSVRAHRFPLDVLYALGNGAIYPLLFPTCVMKRDAFYASGKLSEERIFGNDTKFLFNSFFILKRIMNVNEFLYIRRTHADSLTTSKETSIDSYARRKLLSSWYIDFEAIRNGNIKRAESNLIYVGPSVNYMASAIS